MEQVAPYKEVDSSYIANHIANEKVQFDGKYINTSSEFFSIIGSDSVYIFKVGDEYVFVLGSYSALDNNEGKSVHLVGKFPEGREGELSKQELNDKVINGYWFKADNINIID